MYYMGIVAVLASAGLLFSNLPTDQSSMNVGLNEIESIADEAMLNASIDDFYESIVPIEKGNDLLFDNGINSTLLTADINGFVVKEFSDNSIDDYKISVDESYYNEGPIVRPDGTVIVGGENNSLLFDSYRDGRIRFRSVLENSLADHEISYSLGLDDDEFAKIEESGSIAIYRSFPEEEEPALIALIESPWAVDAEGRSVSTRYALNGDNLVQYIEPSDGVKYPIVADPVWVPAVLVAIRIGVQIVIRVGPRVVTYAVAPASRVVNALRSYSTLTFKAGSKVVRLDKSAMKHVLKRHHPNYWDGTGKSTQTFLNPSMSISNVRGLIHDALKKHSGEISKMGRGPKEFKGSVNGISYKMVIKNGRVVQFYPTN